jgi:hypothetical protein
MLSVAQAVVFADCEYLTGKRVAQFEVLYQHLSGQSEEDHENRKFVHPASRPDLNLVPLRKQHAYELVWTQSVGPYSSPSPTSGLAI